MITLAIVFLILTIIQGVAIALKGNPAKNILNITIIITAVLTIVFMVISIVQK